MERGCSQCGDAGTGVRGGVAHGEQYRLPEMRECDVGAIPGGGTEGEGERGDAGFDAEGVALVGGLSVLLKDGGTEKRVCWLC